MKYVVYVTEKLKRGVLVEAKDMREAREKVQKAYDNEKIVLDYSDYNEYYIECDREASEFDVQNYINVEDL